MIQGAIFDVDGTLFDSMFIWDTIGSDYLKSIGYEPKENLDKTFKSLSIYQAACHYREEYGVTISINEIIDGVNRMVEHYYRNVIQLKPGVSKFLNQLYEKDVKMCVATATDYYLVKAALERTSIDRYFSDIFTCTSVGHGKDQPNIYREALNFLQTEKEKTVVFEDALYAIKTARDDSFITIGVYDSHEENPLKVKQQSNYYISDFLNLNSFWEYISKI